MQHTYQKVVNYLVNSPAPPDDSIYDYANKMRESFGFETNNSSRKVYFLEEYPFVLKVDNEALGSKWLQNKNELALYRQVQNEAPQFLRLLPKIYWVSSCTRFMLVEKIPYEVMEEDINSLLRTTFVSEFISWLNDNTNQDLYEVKKESSWRKVTSTSGYKLVDAGCLLGRFN